MDIFKQKRYLWTTVVVLLILNIIALTVLWIGRPAGILPQRTQGDAAEEQRRLQELLKVELGFDEAQTEQYLKLRRQHHNQIMQLQMDISRVKKQMFDEVLQDNPQQELSDSLLTLAQKKQAQLEKITFQHFLNLKKLCKPDQQHKLKVLLNEFFRKNAPSGIKNNAPRPPANGEHLPPLPPEHR